MKSKLFLLPLTFLLGLVLNGCNTHLAENNIAFESDCWSSRDTIRLTFTPQDTQKVYRLIFPVTFTEDYSYNNVYLNASVKAPSGDINVLPARFNLQESDGKWLSEPVGDEIEFELGIGDALRFNQQGSYELLLYHFMRDEPLCGVRNAGLAIDEMVLAP